MEKSPREQVILRMKNRSMIMAKKILSAPKVIRLPFFDTIGK